MKTAIFHNFTSKPFTGYWDGKKRTFLPGMQKLLPAYLAEHYATHLTNSILIENGDHTATSPKKPEEVPKFMELFNQACIQQDDDEEDDDVVEMPVREVQQKRVKTIVDNEPPMIVKGPDAGADDSDEFEGLQDEGTEDTN